MWIATIALILGAGGGYLLAWATLPANTVTSTVAPAAYATNNPITLQASFDGATCSYNGPAELSAGTMATFNYAATSAEPSALVVFGVAPGTTWQHLVWAATTTKASDVPAFVNATKTYSSSPAGLAQQEVQMSLPSGLYGVGCATSPESTNTMFLATMLRVS